MVEDKERQQFIDGIIASGRTVSVYLSNGIKLVGPILAQSNVALEMGTVNGGEPNLVYLDSVSTIQV